MAALALALLLPAQASAWSVFQPNCDEQPYEGNPVTGVKITTGEGGPGSVSVEWVPGKDVATNGSLGRQIPPIGWDVFIHKVGYPYRAPYAINVWEPVQFAYKEKVRLTIQGVPAGSDYTVFLTPTNAGLYEGLEWQSCGTNTVNAGDVTRKWNNDPQKPTITEASFDPSLRWTVAP